jgi:hypothetical protein
MLRTTAASNALIDKIMAGNSAAFSSVLTFKEISLNWRNLHPFIKDVLILLRLRMIKPDLR